MLDRHPVTSTSLFRFLPFTIVAWAFAVAPQCHCPRCNYHLRAVRGCVEYRHGPVPSLMFAHTRSKTDMCLLTIHPAEV